MEQPNHEEGALPAKNPPPYSEKEQLPPACGTEKSDMPTQYQAYYGPYGAVPGQGPGVQPPMHTSLVIPVEPTHEPTYLGLSIFTMICCFLPLGIAALVYAVRTRDANRTGNGTDAQRYSRMARKLAHAALAVGLAFLILYIVLGVTL